MSKKTSIRKDYVLIMRGIKEINRLAPHMVALNVVMSLFNALTPFIAFIASSLIIDELLGAQDTKKLVMLVVISVTSTLACHIASKLLQKKVNEKKIVFNCNKNKASSKKTLSVDYSLLEKEETHVLWQKVKEAEIVNSSGLWQIVHCMDILLKNLFSVILSFAVLYGIFTFNGTGTGSGILAFVNSYWAVALFAVVVILSIYLAAVTTSKSTNRFFSEMGGFAAINRKYFYYQNNYMANYRTGKDIRIYNIQPLLTREIDSMSRGTFVTLKRLGSALGVYDAYNSSFSALAGGFIYAFVALKALSGAITIGNIVLYAGAATQLISGLSSVFGSISQLRANNAFLELYFEFMDLQGDRQYGSLPIEKSNNYEIEFKNVSFKYPDTDNYVIKDLSFKFKVGEKLAVVGLNGSGKTTMIKLLVRLYDATEGKITLNGVDIRKYDYEEYMSIFSVVFQDFKLFSLPIAQNVAVGNSFDEQAVYDAIEKVGMQKRIERMPKGIGTPLFKDYENDGIEISGGEAQKLALSRALYKDAPFIILDEPTAALDPISEFEIYSAFDEIVGDKTAIYISHRLSSCRFCNNIIVFERGKIIQSGSHDELLADAGGRYHALWNAQSQYYDQVEGF